MQYTIRNVPDAIDAALRDRAKRLGMSLNDVVVDALRQATGCAAEPARFRDLHEFPGTWQNDAAVDAALAAQDQVDEEMWK